jgi:hypothetical protein
MIERHNQLFSSSASVPGCLLISIQVQLYLLYPYRIKEKLKADELKTDINVKCPLPKFITAKGA